MNNLKNHVQLIGNLGKKPETISFESGKKLAKFSIAINENFKNKNGENITETNWFTIITWNKLAEIAENILQKGDEVIITGKLASRTFKDQENKDRNTIEILCQEFLLVNNKNR